MKGKNKFNFWLDITVLTGFVGSALTGILLWLILPHERGSDSTAFWGITRSSWVDIHDWVSLGVLVVLVVHIVIHWTWISAVARRYFTKLARQARINFSLNSLFFVTFVAANLSGLAIWLILPSGGYQGGRNPSYGAMWFGLDRHGWEDIHLWGSVAMIAIAVFHIVLHWKWIALTAKRYLAGTERVKEIKTQPAQAQ